MSKEDELEEKMQDLFQAEKSTVSTILNAMARLLIKLAIVKEWEKQRFVDAIDNLWDIYSEKRNTNVNT